ncbi:MAG: hypothetical protein LBH20_03135 [Treponema sp.]|jgi:hypothetical protein|nr:hypothetical protein [Treponema sp.]
MKRIELIANRSVEKEIISALEEGIEEFYYTLLPQISGRGKTKYRLGTATWPEQNFLLISYLDDITAVRMKAAVQEVKGRFPKEGIKLFIMEADLVGYN